jgi:hypothetical protein
MPYLVENQKARVSTISCNAKGKGPNNGVLSWGQITVPGQVPPTYPSTDTALQELALTRLKRKLKKRVGGADALVPVAESRELRGLIRGMTSMTTTLLETLIDIKRTKGRSALKYASQAWLTYGFGIRPLVDDTKAVAEAIGNYFDRKDTSIRDSASAKKTWLSHYKTGPYTGINGASIYHAATLHHTLSYRWYCGGVADIQTANDYTLAKHLGFTGSELIPTFWELVPYSWVVDYFTTIGSYLEDVFSVLPGSMFYSGYTRRYEVKASILNYWIKDNQYWDIDPRNGTGEFERFEFQRVPLGGALPTIGLRFKSADEVGIFGVTKLLNLASVLIQRKL